VLNKQTLFSFSLCLLLAFSALAQTTHDKKRIAILGFKRFEFQSDYSLKEIMDINQLSSQDEVYELYNDAVLNEISIQTPDLSLFKLPKGESESLQRRIPVVYKEKPSSHLGVDIRYLKERNRMNTLLTNMSADYLLVLTEYKIKSSLTTKIATDDGSKILKWSVHQISYELFDKEAKLVIFGDQIDLKPLGPKKNTMYDMGVAIDLIKDAYITIVEDIENKLKEKNLRK